MKEFINKIEFAPVTDISSISGTTITMRSDLSTDVIYTKNDVIPDEQDSERDGNRFYSQTLNIVCDKLTTSFFRKYRNRKVIVKLFSDDNQEYLMGNLLFPTRCSMSPKLNSDLLKFTCENPDPLVS
ncbi:MAG: hypothetical protein KAR19_03680 [Bacteroidales bacterium]|nr:hypothetical protein [Bacteroidales bacterium]